MSSPKPPSPWRTHISETSEPPTFGTITSLCKITVIEAEPRYAEIEDVMHPCKDCMAVAMENNGGTVPRYVYWLTRRLPEGREE